tara:strand:- start:7916 stop:8218 length:303 start_codon:yes stop_codon:yes gene_type:complete
MKNNEMLDFIEKVLKDTKADKNFQEEMLIEKMATLRGLEALESADGFDTCEIHSKLMREAHSEVKWYSNRIEHSNSMLNLLYTARDIKAEGWNSEYQPVK